jgi:hypothetical protein
MKNKNRPTRQAPGLETSNPQSPARSSVDHISTKAYELYLQQGCPEGRALDHWLQAEAITSGQSNANA